MAMAVGDRQRGVIHGQTFRFGAPSPALDRLPSPLTLPGLAEPAFKTLIARPEATSFLQRLAAFLKKQRRETARERLLRRMRDAMALIRSTMVLPPEPAAPREAVKGETAKGGAAKGEAAGAGHGKFHRPRGLEHPYQLKTVLDLIPELPDAYSGERKYFEELLFAIIHQYKTQIAARHVWTFSFQSEALQYFQLADRVRRRLKRRGSREDVKSLSQLIHDNYFHGIYYYMLSVYIREASEKPNTLFLEFCNASLFLARLDWDGGILEQPSMRRLPSRGQLLYFAIRDESVLKQFNSHYDYARQFKDTLGAFPIESDRPEAAPRKGRSRFKLAFLRESEPEAARAD